MRTNMDLAFASMTFDQAEENRRRSGFYTPKPPRGNRTRFVDNLFCRDVYLLRSHPVHNKRAYYYHCNSSDVDRQIARGWRRLGQETPIAAVIRFERLIYSGSGDSAGPS
ncbi:MAG: hypothetical protein A3H96_23685 [Acidobacteria bacterium RIFCSPLOWO2_02_FULL_67_36]|nr:MAG: hypothetical protein A3H96_23685 [Acidobacteria bacterium RIFCSPLOWO2_02_FULL_67_36]OFW20547.1 MAG: hypothetical protein A3G21_23295 [Acidobacteria bacterium RIFCSPLOWO2_12_FULL_66_21]